MRSRIDGEVGDVVAAHCVSCCWRVAAPRTGGGLFLGGPSQQPLTCWPGAAARPVAGSIRWAAPYRSLGACMFRSREPIASVPWLPECHLMMLAAPKTRTSSRPERPPPVALPQGPKASANRRRSQSKAADRKLALPADCWVAPTRYQSSQVRLALAADGGRDSGRAQLAFAEGGLSLLMGRGRHQPWLRFHCTAGACCGILLGVSGVAAAASETLDVSWTSHVRVTRHRVEFRLHGCYVCFVTTLSAPLESR